MKSNGVANLTPLSSEPVKIKLRKWKTTEDNMHERAIMKIAVNSYLVLPEVGFLFCRWGNRSI